MLAPILLALSLACAPAAAAAAPDLMTPFSAPASLEPIRVLEASDLGVARPSGVAFSASANALLIADRQRRRNHLARVDLFERRLRGIRLPALPHRSALTVDPRSGRVVAVTRDHLITAPASRATGRAAAVQRRAIRRLGLRNPRAATFDADGTALYVLDAGLKAIVRVPVRGERRATRIPLGRLGRSRLSGLAFNPDDGLLYVIRVRDRRLLALGTTGRVRSSRSLGRLELARPGALAFAPSGDNTDDPAALHLYIADGGTRSRPGGIVETSLAARIPFAAVTAANVPLFASI